MTPTDTLTSSVNSSDSRRLELREERASVTKERVQSGTVTIRRELESRTETLSVEVITETLVISTQVQPDGSSASVMVNGQILEAGQEVRIVIHREAAQVEKSVVKTEDVIVRLEKRSKQVSFPVELHRESLVIDKSPQALVSEIRLEAEADPLKG